MNCNLTITHLKKSVPSIVAVINQRLMLGGAITLMTVAPTIAQSSSLEERVAAVKQNLAENKQKLHQYQWTETTQLTLKGDPKPASTNICHYGPDGQVQKTLVGLPPAPSGRKMKQKIIAKKIAEIEDYMEDVKGLLSLYVPPQSEKMQQAYQAGELSLNPAGSVVNLIFKDYARPGDQMTLTFDTVTHKIIPLNINTYMGQVKGAVTLQV